MFSFASSKLTVIRSYCRCIFLGALLLFLGCGCGLAQSKFGQWVHTAWDQRDGAPRNITNIAKGPDGFLWVISDEGVFRFDGSTFELAPIPNDFGVFGRRPMLRRSNGDLWISTLAGIRIVHPDRSQTLILRQQLPFSTYGLLVEDQQRVVWALTNDGLFRYAAERWEKAGGEYGLGKAKLRTLYVGQDGTLWAATPNEVWSRDPGQTRFRSRFQGGSVIASIFEDKQGRIWIGDLGTTVHPVASPIPNDPMLASSIHVGSQGAIVASDGELWITTLGDGIRKVATQAPFGKAEKDSKVIPAFSSADGLSDGYVSAIFRDEDGTIWTGTRGGLDRFRRSPVLTVVEPALASIHKLTTAGEANGNLWVSYGDVLLHETATPTELQYKFLIMAKSPDGTYPTADISSWEGSPPAFCSFDTEGVLCQDGKKVTLSNPAEVPAGYGGGFAWLDPDHIPWLATLEYGIFRRVDNQWTSVPIAGKRPVGDVTAVAPASDGAEWVAFGDRLMKISSHGVLSVPFGAELSVAGIWAIEDRNDHQWFGGESGLDLHSGQHITRFQTDDPGLLAGILGVQEAPNGDIWVSTRKGLLHIQSGEWHRAADADGHLHSFDVLGTEYGLPNAPLNAERLTDKGLLWLIGTGGYGVLNIYDPLPQSAPPVPVLRQIQADGETVAAAEQIDVGPHVTHLRFRFAAVSLQTSQKPLYRYRLDDVEKVWQNAGTASEASYSNLSPGHYVLHVSASTNGGPWSDDVRLVSVYLIPAWYQRFATKALAAVALMLTVLALLFWRIKHAENDIIDRFNARLSERLRISADLHDTFLQTVQGSKLIAEDALSRAKDDDARHTLGRLSSQLTQAASEGRNALQALRLSDDVGDELVTTLANATRESCNSARMTVSLDASGKVRPLHPVLREEIVLLCREAVRNACQHSGGSRVSITLHYGKNLLLNVSDDGKGIAPAILEHGKDGHFGIASMRERAKRMGAKLDLTSSPAGTSVSVELPGSVAFVRELGIARRWRRHSSTDRTS